MKIVVVSPNANSLAHIDTLLRADGRAHEIITEEGGMGKVRLVADQTHPDLVIVDSMCRDLEELSVLDYVSTQHPQTVVILLCVNQTPEFLINAMRAGVREVLPSPVEKGAFLAAIDRIAQKREARNLPRSQGKVLAFMPCKGGSGATFLAANLGYQLAAENKKVLLIDLNLQFGDAILFVHDHKPTTNLGDVAQNIHRLDASLLASSLVNVSPNFGVLAAPEDPGHAVEVRPEHVDALLTLAVTNYDFVILDLGRTLDAVSIRALDRADLVFPVLQMTIPFVRDASRLLQSFKSLGYGMDKIRMIVNRVDKKGELALDDVRRALGVEVYRTVPNSYDVVAASINQGKPIASFARNHAVTRNLQEFAQTLLEKPTERAGLLGRLLRRA